MGLKDRIFSRTARPAPGGDEEVTADANGVAVDTTVVLPAGSLDAGVAAVEATQRIAAVAPAEPQVAADAGDGVDPPPAPIDPATTVPANPAWRIRGRLRRRLRYLREVRELGYRDLGGLVFDQHRFQRPNDGLVHGKVLAIDAVDRELRAIERALHADRHVTELSLPGLSACQRCGALHGSDARFCPQCGLAFAGPRTLSGMGDVHAPLPAPIAGPGQAALFDPSGSRPADAVVQPAPPAP